MSYKRAKMPERGMYMRKLETKLRILKRKCFKLKINSECDDIEYNLYPNKHYIYKYANYVSYIINLAYETGSTVTRIDIPDTAECHGTAFNISNKLYILWIEPLNTNSKEYHGVSQLEFHTTFNNAKTLMPLYRCVTPILVEDNLRKVFSIVLNKLSKEVQSWLLLNGFNIKEEINSEVSYENK